MWHEFIASDLFLLTLTVGLYCVGMRLYRRVVTHPLPLPLVYLLPLVVCLCCSATSYPPSLV